MDLLIAKAKSGNLTVCMPKINEIGNQLKQEGAELCIYGDENFCSPSSRFTIVYSGNGGSRVAIGKTDGNNHVITEFGGNDPALHLACDLVVLARLRCREADA